MKWLNITEEIFLNNREKSDIVQKDGSCFGADIEGKFYLYVDNGCDYILNIYNRSLREILDDDMFFECMAKWMLDYDRHITDLLCWYTTGRKISNMPFMLEDIHYCDYDG